MERPPRTGLVFSDRYLQHNTNPLRLPLSGGPLPFVETIDHYSNPRLVERSKKLLDLTGLSAEMVRVEPYTASVDDLVLYHQRDYIERVRQLCAAGGGDAGQGAPVGPDSFAIAQLAAGGVMAAVDAVMSGTVEQCLALVRPPGHHAVAGLGMGFCVFANVAVAALHARQRHGVDRILILDWDVHHGNGTQEAFYADPNVLFISLHQAGLYPEQSGTVDEVGASPGEGYTVNIPLPAGSGDAAYLAAFERLVISVATAFQPQLVIISAGQDASTMDPLGRMCLTAEGYRRLTAAMQGIAARSAAGRLVVSLEGGYSEIYAPYCTLAIAEQLVGSRTGIEEPLDPARLSRRPESHTVSGDQASAIERAAETIGRYWPL